MRISKKYAGKSIGKHVFLSRIPSILNRNGSATGVPGGDGKNPSLLQTTQENLQKIRDLEFHFHMSLLQEGTSCPLGANVGKSLGVNSGGLKGVTLPTAMNVGIPQNSAVNPSPVPMSMTSTHSINNSNQNMNQIGADATVGNGSFPVIFPTPQAKVS